MAIALGGGVLRRAGEGASHFTASVGDVVVHASDGRTGFKYHSSAVVQRHQCLC